MRKKFSILLFIFSVVVVTASFAAMKDDIYRKPVIIFELPEKETSSKFCIPDSIEIIEEEAFEGTAIVEIELPDTVTIIGERAFANINTLRSICIPMATTTISSSAFDDSNNVTITAVSNSFARKYAKKQGIPFAPIPTFCALNHGTISFNILGNAHIDINNASPGDDKPEQQWRKLDEIYVVGTLDIIFNDIQSRGPPMGEVKC